MEKDGAKSAKLAIKKAIDLIWRKLYDEVEHDPWGMPYKLMMGKLVKTPPIPGLNTPGTMAEIVVEQGVGQPKGLNSLFSAVIPHKKKKYRVHDARGEGLIILLDSFGLVVLNEKFRPTFVGRSRGSIMDNTAMS
ncbi:Hypothetical protein CINCED_3A019125 [Cinara cedri]|uniref:Uncharacterized protein n=1 Tax=Cinara cedri TaxID=506608 RepID=A0A5E4MIT8_9HEMI|nr:Hypothetical protein CINCED_3A019125 [Cinara cedri]